VLQLLERRHLRRLEKKIRVVRFISARYHPSPLEPSLLSARSSRVLST
tara:strand:+ start:213 stop:356 length:144 start_codon:yes stop_codon:yes gene_type:complete